MIKTGEFKQPKDRFHGSEDFKEWVEKKLGLPSVIWLPARNSQETVGSGHRRFVSSAVIE